MVRIFFKKRGMTQIRILARNGGYCTKCWGISTWGILDFRMGDFECSPFETCVENRKNKDYY